MINEKKLDQQYMRIRNYISSNNYDKETALKEVNQAINTAYEYLGKTCVPLHAHIVRLTRLEEIIKKEVKE